MSSGCGGVGEGVFGLRGSVEESWNKKIPYNMYLSLTNAYLKLVYVSLSRTEAI